MIESMSNLKNEGSKIGTEMYQEYRTKCGNLIEELRADGVTEQTHPTFQSAVTSYNYWK